MRRWVKAVGLVVALVVGGVVAYEGWAVWRAGQRTPAIIAAVRAEPVELRLADLPAERLAMLLAVEDPGFRDHRGVDFSTPGQGATTITQSLVKQLYFERFQPGFAKLEQSLIARFVLHPAMGKDEQLELFLNRAYFGHVDGQAVRGFAAASRVLFGRDLARISDQEFLMLVAMLVAPNDLHPVRAETANRERVARIQALLDGRCAPRNVGDAELEGCAGA